mmetsp:Transcript_17351/g.56802  ORF Transcript_17351/g.56802 Transcript_17351/m.56802 type:complete len:235 (-) Transcript_17351:299-1003(-)
MLRVDAFGEDADPDVVRSVFVDVVRMIRLDTRLDVEALVPSKVLEALLDERERLVDELRERFAIKGANAVLRPFLLRHVALVVAVVVVLRHCAVRGLTERGDELGPRRDSFEQLGEHHDGLVLGVAEHPRAHVRRRLGELGRRHPGLVPRNWARLWAREVLRRAVPDYEALVVARGAPLRLHLNPLLQLEPHVERVRLEALERIRGTKIVPSLHRLPKVKLLPSCVDHVGVHHR